MKKGIRSLNISDIMPFAILLFMIVIFGIATGGNVFSIANLRNLFNQSLAIIIAALGMVFVASMGGTDITHGSLLALATVAGAMAAESIGFWAFIPVTVLVGVLSGAFMGVVNAKLKVPSFMASLALLMAYRAYVNLLLNANAYLFPSSLSFLGTLEFEIIAVILFSAAAVYIFHYTPFGVYLKAIGENENAVRHAGVKIEKMKIIAFMISGAMAAVAGIFLMARVGGTSNTLGAGFEMKVMMAMFIGGIPVEGGMASKIYKIIIGAPTIIFLENGLVLCGMSGSVTQLIRGIVLLLAIYITMQANEKLKINEN